MLKARKTRGKGRTEGRKVGAGTRSLADAGKGYLGGAEAEFGGKTITHQRPQRVPSSIRVVALLDNLTPGPALSGNFQRFVRHSAVGLVVGLV